MSARLSIPITEDDHILGEDSATVMLVEYGDYQCPACAAAHSFVKSLQAQYPVDLCFVFRNFPLAQLHPLAESAAEIAEGAAAAGKFWPMHDWLYENQSTWTRTGVAGLLLGAQGLGINERKLLNALEDESTSDRIQRDFKGGVRAGVNGTPTFFVNGELHYGDLQDLAALIEQTVRTSTNRSQSQRRIHEDRSGRDIPRT